MNEKGQVSERLKCKDDIVFARGLTHGAQPAPRKKNPANTAVGEDGEPEAEHEEAVEDETEVKQDEEQDENEEEVEVGRRQKEGNAPGSEKKDGGKLTQKRHSPGGRRTGRQRPGTKWRRTRQTDGLRGGSWPKRGSAALPGKRGKAGRDGRARGGGVAMTRCCCGFLCELHLAWRLEVARFESQGGFLTFWGATLFTATNKFEVQDHRIHTKKIKITAGKIVACSD